MDLGLLLATVLVRIFTIGTKMADSEDYCPSCLAQFALIARSRIGVVEVVVYDCPLCKQFSKHVFKSPSLSRPMSSIVKNKQYGGSLEDA